MDSTLKDLARGGKSPFFSQVLVQQLMNTPETGMGYHIADVTFSDGRVQRNALILCGTQLHDEGGHYDGLEIVAITVKRRTGA